VDAAPGANEELYAQLVLQRANLLPERGLREVELRRRGVERPLRHDRIEGPKLSDLHEAVLIMSIRTIEWNDWNPRRRFRA
jgi:hypothetical protein